MADIINVGTTANDGTGDTLRAAFQKVNTKFTNWTAATDPAYGATGLGVADDAAAIAAALAAKSHVILPIGTYKNTAGFTVASGKTLELLPGAAFSGAGTITRSGGSSVISKTAGANSDCWYWGRKFTGSRTAGSDAMLDGYTPYAYMYDVRSDDSDVGSDFGVCLGARQFVGGSSTKGGRIAASAALWFTAATNAANANRNYVGHQASVTAQAGDGGTNTGAGSLGAFFGAGSAVYLDAAATNLNDAVGHEVNVFTKNGATSKYIRGLAITGCNYTRGATLDAAISIGAQAATGGYGPHAGWRFGICFTDTNGAVPFTATSSLMGVVSTAAIPLLDGFDLSGFTFAGQIIKGVYFAANESSISLGDSGGNAQITVAGASTNANLILSPKGTGVISTGTNGYAISGTKVVGARDTGWTAMTGSTDKATAYATSTVTLAQLAGRVMALQAALTTHGLIGA